MIETVTNPVVLLQRQEELHAKAAGILVEEEDLMDNSTADYSSSFSSSFSSCDSTPSSSPLSTTRSSRRCDNGSSPLLPKDACFDDEDETKKNTLENEERTEDLQQVTSCSAADSAAIVTIQTVMRGTLARWNVPILKLQAKLASIQALKDKQLKKVQERKQQTMRSVKAQVQYEHEHVTIRRRLKRCQWIQHHYAREKTATLHERQDLQIQCRGLSQSNDACAHILGTYIQNIEMAQNHLALMKAQQKQLQETCATYQTMVQVVQEYLQEGACWMATTMSK